MISILVCSVRPDLYQQLVKNVEETIGVDYEMLCHDNRKTNQGLCEVYNLLAKAAKYDVLCFIHEDIVFTTIEWGKTLMRIFSGDNIGVIGVAGSKYKSKKFSGWFTGLPQLDCGNIIHQFPDRTEKIFLQPEKGSMLEDVVCIDGVFMCCTKEVWREIKFDSRNITGFHFYDIDFSLRAARRHRVVVTYEIEMIHITVGGDFGDRWVNTAFSYHMQNKDALPFTKQDVPSNTEIQVAKTILDLLKPFSISFRNKLKWINLQKLWRYPVCYYDILKFLTYRPLGLKHVHKFFKSR